MRRSALRHPLAVLRKEIGITQVEMGDLVGCSTETIASIETLRMPLSEKLAGQISIETGVNLAWLLNGDPAAQILDGIGRSYTWDTFEMVQSGRRSKGIVTEDAVIKAATDQIRRILRVSKNNADRQRAVYRIDVALRKVLKACMR